MARSRTYTSGEQHLQTGRRFVTQGQAMRRTRSSGFKSRFRSMAGASPVGEMSMVSEVRPRRITGRATGSLPSRMPVFGVDPRSILQWEQYALDFRENAVQFRYAIDRIVMIYALVSLAGAQKRSLGPVDPGMQRISAAWKIPVRRITGDYFMGWDVKHISLGIWALTNNSREGFYIEFGINHSVTTGAVGPGGMRVRIRRPIMKLAVMEAVNIIRETGAAQREVLSSVTPGSLYQSPLITGAVRPAGRSGSAAGLVDIEALQAMVTSGGGGGV